MLLEVRAGEGGEDALAFARELASALESYATRIGCRMRTLEEQSRTVRRTVSGDRVGELERFVGTHRVQRVPAGERKGRRHTSTATVALLPEDTATHVEVPDDELEIQFYRGTGPGGQHRNKASTAVRVRHRPTGTVVTVESGRSQYQNLAWAKEEVRRRLTEQASAAVVRERNGLRSGQIRTGERSAKSYTHNTQRDEVLCHETGERWRLEDFRRGRLDQVRA